ncbi:MAG: 3-oxo-tetronate kinase [Caldimonas sp.]
MTIRLGCIADDFTGATDLANNLVRAGMRVVQTIGVPDDAATVDADAVVVALKSRTTPPEEAVRQSLAACRWLRRGGATQIYFKVCSTFDSTPRGNIGPVLEALMDELGCAFTIATPAFPDNARTVFKGHLFVGDVLLSDSGMRDHPLTPMTDANLVRVLQAQLAPARGEGRAGRRVGLVDHRATGASAAAIGARFNALREEGVAIAIADAIGNDDLHRLGEAVRDLPLVCAGSGLAIGLPRNFAIAASGEAAALPAVKGFSAIVSGSCSQATNAQVAAFISGGGAARRLDPLTLGTGTCTDAGTGTDAALAEDIATWAGREWATAPDRPVLVYSTAPPGAVAAAQAGSGAQDVGARLERLLAGVTRALVERGARRLVVAGGETSGAAVQALAIDRLRIGRQIDPGVPWCHAAPAIAADGLQLALKSGNFGGVDFFERAFEVAT